MKDIILFEGLGLERNFSNAPFYCGAYERYFTTSLYIEAWKQYDEGYTSSFVEITCPLLENGHVIVYASENSFSLTDVKKILRTLKKCLEFYK